MDLIVLAGGLGTRLRSVTGESPKVLAPVCGLPFIDIVLQKAVSGGCIRNIILAVSYRADEVVSHIGTSFMGVPVRVSYEKEPLGTGGALKQAAGLSRAGTVCVLNGDTYYDVDLKAMLARHKEGPGKITVALKPMRSFSRYGSVEVIDGMISAFREKKQTDEGLINGGVYIADRKLLTGTPGTVFSLEKTVLEARGTAKNAFICDGTFIDIGVPEDYERAQKMFMVRPFVYLDRDGVINEEVDHPISPSQARLLPGAAQALKLIKGKGYETAVISNQSAVAKGMCTVKDVDAFNRRISADLCALGAPVPPFFICPHHPDGSVKRYSRNCPDRKPEPGLIYKAAFYFAKRGIFTDLNRSVCIGDKESDIGAGVNAGIGTNILVRSGHKTDEENTQADLTVDDLLAAAGLICGFCR